MKRIFNRQLIEKIFDLTILAKALFGFIEILAGIILLTSGRLIANNLIIALTEQEILADSNDFISNYLISVLSSFSLGINLFAIVYLLFHGIINIFLAEALLKDKLWAYPWAIVGFSLFIIYQVFRYFHSFSLLLLFLILFDIFIVSVVSVEYRNKKRKRKIKHETNS